MKRIIITFVASLALVAATAYAFAAMAQNTTTTDSTNRVQTTTSTDTETTTAPVGTTTRSSTTDSYQSTSPNTNYNNTRADRTDRTRLNDDPLFTFGLKAGVNLSQLRGDDLSLINGNPVNFNDNSNRSLGLVVGGFFRVGRTVYLQPEILLSQKAGRFAINRGGGTVNAQNVDIRFTNIDFPILVGVKIADVFRINAGPILTFTTSDNGNLRDTFAQYSSDNFDNSFKKGNVGYQAGVGLDIGKFMLDVRYEGNLTNVFNVNVRDVNSSLQFGRKLNLWQATIGFKFL
ncbi:MAG: PorT family protein [Cytophagaceae bacterium]|nr:PorT family protein [Cytophagaceae bacterium]